MRAVGKSGIHTRVVGLDRETNKELLLKHIRANGDNGTPFKECCRDIVVAKFRHFSGSFVQKNAFAA